MRNILIFGSCVTRDSLNFDHDRKLDLIGYYARSSIASAFSEYKVQDVFSKNLKSPFQSRIVGFDLLKSVQLELSRSCFQTLVLDLIDERFNLFVFEDGGICTLSNELLSTGFDPVAAPGVIIKSGSDDFYKLWEKGWSKLIGLLKNSGGLDKLRINKIFWSQHTQRGDSYLPTYSAQSVNSANDFLRRLYDRIAQDIESFQIFEFSEEQSLGADDHRWGKSPFHYVNEYYAALFEKIKASLPYNEEPVPAEKLEPAVNSLPSKMHPDREIEDLVYFSSAAGNTLAKPLALSAISGNGTCRLVDGNVEVIFTGDAEAYQVRFKLPRPHFGNGISVRFKISGWACLRYVAVGYTFEKNFRHVKIVNIAHGSWIEFSIGHNDIAFGLQNDWKQPTSTDISDIRLYFKGTPVSEGATALLESFSCWRESEEKPSWLAKDAFSSKEPLALTPELLTVMYSYLNKCFRTADAQAKAFLSQAICPLYGEVLLNWQGGNAVPEELDKVGSYKFSWHALHPATILMVYAHNSGELSPVFAAREFITNWLERSYYNTDEDKKFAWYDHGTAERLMAFLLMWNFGVTYKFDHRFMLRLRLAIFRHAQLLASEAFYAFHQPTRYHNHAWFQDLALMASSLAMPDFQCSTRWLKTAMVRLNDQLDQLIVRDNGFSIFIENSIGYHRGVQRLVEYAGELTRLTGEESPIPEVAKELVRFSEFLRYPDNRTPAQGDTYRLGNASGADIRRLKPYTESEIGCTVLPKAGYAVVKGNHDGCRFMLSMFATSLCSTHKHEDNLSFTLFFDGIEWLIDPSFYSHEYSNPLPKYLKSAWAHNAIAIKGAEYSIEPGLAQLDDHSDKQVSRIEGWHTAYKNFKIKRSLESSLDKLALKFSDSLKPLSATSPDAEAYIRLHLGEGVTSEKITGGIQLSHTDSTHILKIHFTGSSPDIHHGWSKHNQLHGVSGLGFMQHADIQSVSVRLATGITQTWYLETIKRER